MTTLLLATLSLFAGTPPDSTDGPTVEAARTSVTVTVDGLMDEAAWTDAAPTGEFVQLAPSPGRAATERTSVRVLYDDRALYVFARMRDRQPANIRARLARRDTGVPSDWFYVGLDTHGDDRTGFVFGVNAAGIQQDYLVYDDVRTDVSWDAEWDATAVVDSTGWSVEMRIPLNQVQFEVSEGEYAWGVQFSRTIDRKGETAYWAPRSPTEDGIVSRFGQLTGVADLAPPRRVDLRPYVASRLDRAPGDLADPYHDTNALSTSVGLDLRYDLTSDLTLAATVNPDFGQVEADPAQLNLTAFELFFPERRPFFVEGTDVFAYGRTRALATSDRPRFLYTRRIGRAPQRRSFVPGETRELGDIYTDTPDQTTILGAAKVSGRIGDWSVGVLDAVTATEYGRYAAVGADGGVTAEGRAPVAPATNYFVGRARRTSGASTVGLIATAVNRPGAHPDLLSALPSQAYVAGADAEHRWADGRWIVSAVAAASHLSGTPESVARVQRGSSRYFQRPDAPHLEVDDARTSLSGASAELAITKAGGGHWVGSLSAATTTPGFDVNELGYQNRSDIANVVGIAAYVEPDPSGPLRTWSLAALTSASWNYAGDRIGTEVGLGWNGSLQSRWGGRLEGQLTLPSKDDRLTRGGVLAATPLGAAVSATAHSDPGRPVSGSATASALADAAGGRAVSASLNGTYRPLDALRVSLGVSLDVGRSGLQYVGEAPAPADAGVDGRRYLFATADQTALAAPIRVEWSFSPTLSLQGYARPYVARAAFSRFKELRERGTVDFVVYGEDRGTIQQADGGEVVDPGDGGDSFPLPPAAVVLGSLQGSAVLRWEVRTGSTLFVGWEHAMSEERLGERVGLLDALSGPVRNTLFVKLSYKL